MRGLLVINKSSKRVMALYLNMAMTYAINAALIYPRCFCYKFKISMKSENERVEN